MVVGDASRLSGIVCRRLEFPGNLHYAVRIESTGAPGSLFNTATGTGRANPHAQVRQRIGLSGLAALPTRAMNSRRPEIIRSPRPRCLADCMPASPLSSNAGAAQDREAIES